MKVKMLTNYYTSGKVLPEGGIVDMDRTTARKLEKTKIVKILNTEKNGN